jgi:RNA polymerase sigma-70 factor (ECF subfamily)
MIWKRRKPTNPEAEAPGAETGESPQLSQGKRVPSDMSSMAIGGAFARPGSMSENPSVRVGDRQSIATQDDAQVMLRVREGDDAEELAQEVFLRVYRSRTSYSADAKFTTWLYRIATNLAVNHARDHKHDRPEEKASLDEVNEETGLSLELADDRPNIEQQMLRQERLLAIRSRIEALPERQRAAVMMHKYQELDYRQISEVMHLSESATKSLLFRAYETLREGLKDFV